MRKRSGALHSDSEQQFLMLAQLSNQKTGYFYDEALHSQLSQRLEKFKPQPLKNKKKCTFQGFDFSAEDLEKQEEQRQLQTKKGGTLINIVLICEDQSDIMSILNNIWPSKEEMEVQSPERRQIDLFMAKLTDQKGFQNCYKFWITSPSQVDNPILQSYIKKASKIINFTTHSLQIGVNHPWQKANEVLLSLVDAKHY